ncbi:MAG: hypothetical protein ACKOCW_09975 [Planctomycetaceae bacterium]
MNTRPDVARWRSVTIAAWVVAIAVPAAGASPGALPSDIAARPLDDGPAAGVPIDIDVFADEGVIPAGAIVPATPIAPGQGPDVDALGPAWGEQRTARRFWYARATAATWVPRGPADGFGMVDVPLSTSLAPVWFDDLPALMVSPAFGFHFWQPPDVLELPSTVYDSSVDVVWRTPLTERLGIGLGITPGVYGDYRSWNPRAFQLTGWGVVDLRVAERLSLVAGAAVVRQLDLRVLPVGGLIWSPRADTRLEVLVPRSRLTRKLADHAGGGSTWTYVACQFGGGTWAVTMPDDSTAVVTSSDLRAVLGVEVFRSRTMAGIGELGYVFSRTISANGTPEYNPADAVMLQLGATF